MKEVIVTISHSGISALIRPIAVMPSMLGISRSMRTTSGFSRRAIATPSEPSDASPTTSMSSSMSKKVRSPIRTTWWSSTSRTRIGAVASAKGPPGGWDARVCGPAPATRESSKASLLG
jgi:hypothetical protein